jgi:hypothetical protein
MYAICVSVTGHRVYSTRKSVIAPVTHFCKAYNATDHGLVQLVEALRYKPEGRGFDSRLCHWIFLLPLYGPGVDSASNRDEYQECFLGVNVAGA